MTDRDVIVSGSFNTRDLGGYRTKHGKLAWRKTFRSGNMCKVDQTGILALKQLGVTRIIDLRSQKERDAEPDPIRAGDNIELISIPLFDDLNPNQLPGGNALLDLYLDALKTHGMSFIEVLRKIGECRDAVLFHCTAGKDRTGLIAALLLSLSGVARADIINDYAMTADRLGPLLMELEKTVGAFNLNKADFMPMLESNPITMSKTLDWLDSNFGGAEEYVRSHGFTNADLAQIRSRWCLTDPEMVMEDV
ncbi:tyrosine-protein phosphatase [Falsochrobactrum ovis]|uniref:Protein-tyrosine phosphatase n=1 Tax=Falsochrobactrum ovis TaxID=1293442 RepID=A0A364JTH3_9HYPH|nr:tyrosine-protein phosphatase [Falsochrobactrum ovis]RAK27053.1 protein-tyrosine phosphatase [Falsochrobactrum ovis]